MCKHTILTLMHLLVLLGVGNLHVKFPLILFINGHHTHLTYQLSELCSELSIILIFLYPNTQRLFLPLAIATFRPQKMG